ncbi:type II toxin-antitoxin system RelE/ParE family toxin [Candidatus Wolfebacteria bacterium]|nr:type II toxin-antitoxin system RelE/ParE family toxin [Candidatus Wolfebacteria bacterium]
MEIHYAYKAADDLARLSQDIQERIAKKMRFYAALENPLKFAERLTDPREGEFRFRVGDWRLPFDIKKNKIFILRVKHRSKAY